MVHAQSPAPSGSVLTIAGNGVLGYSGDGGPATNAMIGGINGLAVGPDGTLYLADTSNQRVRAVNPATGIIRTIAGNGGIGDTGNNGPATNATFGIILTLAADRGRNALYLADVGNNWVRKVDLTSGLLTVSAGSGPFGAGFDGDGGPATAAQFNFPERLATDAVGALSICDVLNFRIRQVHPITGIVTTIAGDGNAVSAGDGGLAINASFGDLTGIAADAVGNVFAVDTPAGPGRSVRHINALTGIITTIAGGGTNMPGSGLATNMNFTDIRCLAAGSAGELFIATPYRVFKLDLANNQLTPFAGDGIGGSSSSNGVPALDAQFELIAAVAVPPGGGLIIADADNARIRYVVPDSINLSNDGGQTSLSLPWVGALAGDLIIAGNPDLTNVILASLTSVAGDVLMSANPELTSVALNSLETAAGTVMITDNPSVTDVAMGSLTSVTGNVTLSGNTAAATVDLSSLSTVTGDLSVNGNSSATTLNLNSLETAGGDVAITGNLSVTDVAMGSLASVTGDVTVSGNTAATNVDLSSLSTANGDVTIESNAPNATVNLNSLTSFGCGTNLVAITLDGGTFEFTNGLTLCTNATLAGSSTVDGSITNHGTIDPGSSPGGLNIRGSLVLLAGSRLRFELSGPAAGSQYDQLNISNAVTYGGTLNVQLNNAFTPSTGQLFQLINASNRLGAFANVNLPALPAGRAWTNRLAADGSIGVVAQVTPPQLLSPLVKGDGSFQFGFSNLPGASFTVLTTTNVALPLSNWTAVTGLTEVSPGQFEFSDSQGATNVQRFYHVRSP